MVRLYLSYTWGKGSLQIGMKNQGNLKSGPLHLTLYSFDVLQIRIKTRIKNH